MKNVKDLSLEEKVDVSNQNDADALKEQLLSDPKIQAELKLRNIEPILMENKLSFLIDFSDSLEKCSKCKDPDNCLLINPYSPTNLVLENNRVVRQMGTCPFYERKLQLSTQFVYSDFPKEWLDDRFANVKKTKQRFQYLEALLNMQAGAKDWIYVYGQPRRGKTYLAVTLLNELVSKDNSLRVGVVNFPNFINENMGDYFKNKIEVDKKVEELSKLDYLVLTHFGNETVNSLVIENVLLPILTYRNQLKLPTIFISELSLSNIKTLYQGPKTVVRGTQVINRIQENITGEIELGGIAF